MTYVTGNQGRPIQGVSQQPDKNRNPGQCTISENLRPDIVRGLSSRQGTFTANRLTNASKDMNAKWHHYERDEEEYVIQIEPTTGKLRAWTPNFNGPEHIINVQDNAEVSYLADADPLSNLELLTIADYTFIVNKTKQVAESSTTVPALENKAIVYIQFKDYSQITNVYLDDVLVATHKSLNGGSSSHKESVIPAIVALRLYEAMQGQTGSNDSGIYSGTDITATYDLELKGNCIYISRKDAGSFKIFVSDSVDGANAVAIFKVIEKTTLLPNRAPNNFKVEVSPPGGNTTDNANYWLQATTVDGASGNTMTWNEALAPGIKVGMDAGTMPHVLVRESVNPGTGQATFTLRRGEWKDREVGDDRTNPLPSYIGEKIRSIGLMQNRLYFTANESVIMTQSNDFFDFFRTTAQASLDTDPIDIYSDSEQLSFLDSSVSLDGDLALFSKNAQFILPGDKILTKSNATLRQTTTFEANLAVPPVASGDNIFFAFDYGIYTGVREYFTDSVTDTKRARPVTDHVKEYIAGPPKLMKTSTNLSMLVIKADDDNILYVFDWLWQGNEKVQAAWGKVIFPETDKILFFEFKEDQLKLVILRDDLNIDVEIVDLGDPDDINLDFPLRLDRKVRVNMTKQPDNSWTVTNPYPSMSTDELVIVRTNKDAYPEDAGTPVNYIVEGSTLRTYENLAAGSVCEVIIGRKYKCRYQPTNPVAKDKNGAAMNLDRLTVGAFYVNYNTSGDVRARVKDKYGNVRETTLGNRTLGGPENLVGFAPLVEGQHRIPIRKKSDQFELVLITESHLPLAIRDFSYNGNLNRRGARM